MYFLLGLMVLGLAVLAGGQVWAVTGSTTSACFCALGLVGARSDQEEAGRSSGRGSSGRSG